MSEDEPIEAVQESSHAEAGAEGAPLARQPKRRLWLLWLLAAVAVIAAGAVGTSLIQQKQAEDPAYALHRLAAAADNEDWERVQRYMDVEAVALGFAETTIERALSGDGTVDSAGAGGGMGSGGFPAGKMQGRFAAQFKDLLKSRVESGDAFAEGSLFGALLAESQGDIERVSAEEASATVEVAAADGEVEDVTLRMSRIGEDWVLVAVGGTTDLLRLFGLLESES
jgi:hypothetical protein